MTCQDVRPHLLDYQRGGLDPDIRAEVDAHLESCAACAREEATEQMLTKVLEERLPQHAASLALKRRLAARWPLTPAPRPSWWSGRGRSLVPAFAVAVVLLAVIPLVYRQAIVSRGDGPALVAEAVNDHVRILSSRHPLDVESGNMHQVKPWFEGRLDFAPVVAFLGDEQFPLQGGAVGYFLDRKAAVLVFHRRLHTISLFVFQAERLPWPPGRLEPIGGIEAYTTAARGFSVILWQRAGLGYALVSDVDRQDLTKLAVLLAGGA